MNFLFSKLFEEYQRKSDNAVFNVTLYISLFYFFLLFNFYLPLSEIFNKIYLHGGLKYGKFSLTIFVFAIIGIINYGVYIVYIKNGLLIRLVNKYKCRKMNRFVLYLIVALLPVFLLVSAATLTVLLKGGNILSYHFKGLL